MIKPTVLQFFSKEARAPRDYKREYAQYHSKPEQIDNRSTRNKARRKLGLKKGDPREVDHKVPLSKGGGNGRDNLRAVSLQANRRKFTKTANDRERTYAEMRDAIRGFAAKQNIDPEKAMLVAGGAGYMHGMRDEVNDLDFFHDDLPDFVQEPYGRFDMDGGPGKDLPDAAKQYQMMHGMRVQTPESMLAFYQRLNRPKDQEKIKMLKAHLKTASTKHHLITGVPGAGKSTLAKRVAKEKGLPLFEIDSDPRFKMALQLVDEGKMDESNALQRQMFRDAVARKEPHVIEGAQVMLDPALAKQHELQILDDSADVLAPRWAKREAGKHRDRALKSGRKPSKDEAYYDRLYRDTVYPRYQKQLKGLRSKNL